MLRRVHANPNQAGQVGLQAAKFMREAYNPKVIGEQISQRLAAIQQITRAPFSAPQ
jgi:hypothetical protein